MTVGGSCRWSPARTAFGAFSRADQQAASRACEDTAKVRGVLVMACEDTAKVRGVLVMACENAVEVRGMLVMACEGTVEVRDRQSWPVKNIQWEGSVSHGL